MIGEAARLAAGDRDEPDWHILAHQRSEQHAAPTSSAGNSHSLWISRFAVGDLRWLTVLHHGERRDFPSRGREYRLEGCVGLWCSWRECHQVNHVADKAIDCGRKAVDH